MASVESDADRNAMLEDWSEAVVDGEIIKGIFDNDYVPIDLNDDTVESSVPMLLVTSNDAIDVVHGSPVTVDGRTFNVVEIQPDGTGFTQLRLHEQ